MFRQLILAAAVLVLAACSPDKAAAPEPAATNFITANVAPPATAADTKGDGVLRDADNRPYGYALLGEKFPEFTAKMADGQTFDSAVLNRWMVIDVWGIWCGDCMRDAPYVAALATAIEQDPDLYFLSIHVPANASRISDEELYGKYGSVEAYFAEKGYSYPTVLDTDTSIREKLKISWTPSYLLISPDGIIRAFRTDLSVAGGEPVKDFLKDVARVKSEVRKAEFGGTLLPASIGPEGTMGLKGTTPFTLDAMKAAFPGHEILTDRAYAGEQTYPVFLIQTLPADGEAGRLVYVVEPDWTLGNVGAVVTRNPNIVGPDGSKVGQTKLKALSPEARSVCKLETGPMDSLFICPDSAENPRFIGAFGAGGDFDGKLSDAAPDYQEEAVLLEMKYVLPAPSAAQ
ncbi:TlpA family protein disulfide reductase [Hyphomonas chukchiensis]|uniref:Thioredoxin domain-containing protein n=1 Tax=Hyphomonas chukchiensis TaxID=1280947 RepID=A0A062UI89_9PROT|nr:TlpA disulfide reductase family protein [Hyphomonas chukchiensis]KCZ58741.1 hypothetical protein HY30_03125 [Hyphomonas chukchiensis]